MSRFVGGAGSVKAKIVLVGEAPGEQEERLGIPFVGGAGHTLDGFLREVGLERSDLYITNIVKMRPPNNDFGIFYSDKSRRYPTNELLKWRDELIKEIKAISPNVVVPLGNESLKALCNVTGITNWRGSLLWSEILEMKVIPTFHPSYIQRGMWEERPLVICDLKKVKAESTFPEYRYVAPKITIVASVEEAIRLLSEMQMGKTPVSFDIETAKGRMVLTAIGFANDPDWGFSIPFVQWTGNKWREAEEFELIMAIKTLLESDVPKIAQNVQFDGTFLKATLGIDIRNLWMDTMIAAFNCHPGLPKGLDTLASIYTTMPYWKHLAKDNLFEYNGLDAVGTWRVAMELEKELADLGMDKFYREHDHILLTPLTEMQLRGIKVDLEKRKIASESLHADISAAQEVLYEKAGSIFNVNSPKQVGELLYDKLGYPRQYSRKSKARGLTVDEEALEKLAKERPSQVLDLILQIRGLTKLASTYIDATLDDDNRIRCSYVIGGAETGRLASRKSIFGSGCDLQNVPSGICREILLPDEGKVMVEVDLSQAEARVVAYLAGDEKMIAIFTGGGDVHQVMADLLSVERDLAKKIVHGSHYGMGDITFARHAGVSVREGKILRQTYFELFPSIRKWQMDTDHKVGLERVLINLLGRRGEFFGLVGPDMFREAYAFIPQSTVSDVLNTALIRTYQMIRHMDVQLLLQVHDSFILQQVQEDNKLMEIIESAFNIPLTYNGQTFVIPYEIKTGLNWNDMKKINV